MAGRRSVIFAAVYAATVLIWDAPLWPGLIYIGASLITFFEYAGDKRAAQRYGQRVSENTLLFLGFIGGWPSAIIAQQTLRHKTIKQPFRGYHWFIVVANVAIFVFLVPPAGARVIAALLVDRFSLTFLMAGEAQGAFAHFRAWLDVRSCRRARVLLPSVVILGR